MSAEAWIAIVAIAVTILGGLIWILILVSSGSASQDAHFQGMKEAFAAHVQDDKEMEKTLIAKIEKQDSDCHADRRDLFSRVNKVEVRIGEMYGRRQNDAKSPMDT